MSAAAISKMDVAHDFSTSEKVVRCSHPQSLKASFRASQQEPQEEEHLQLRSDIWEEPLSKEFKVRGKGYLTDHEKVASESSVFQLMAVDLIHVDEPIMTGLCEQHNERIQRSLLRERETGQKQLPAFVFVVNLSLPATHGRYYHCACYFGIEDVAVLNNQDTPLGRVASPFFFGDDNEFRDKTFKLIPRVAEGNFLVKSAVGSKPVILGTKVKQHYVQSDRYFELIVDIGSDAIAQSIVKYCLGYAKTLVVDMVFVLEGRQDSMLPERILGGARLKHIDFARDGQRRLV